MNNVSAVRLIIPINKEKYENGYLINLAVAIADKPPKKSVKKDTIK